ncbi:hypothetical protein [Dokdonia pacifica]|uniref:Uncharacterized protein n=1 Tax=Dokdonia pacifica TaxID=1627892 RepID=A0A238VM95_9FLAO|nr:hypothetical protein [Dokdonia pacifica]SNR35301.1 hypothetical protein SAMN06265376_10124 [Dokdonia pacifica]
MESKQRHGCVTAWLIFMIIGNSYSTLSYLFIDDMLSQFLSEPIQDSMRYALVLLGILNLIIFILMLVQMRKWTFWAYVGTGLITFLINISIGLGVGPSIIGFMGVVILYAVLQIKQNGKTAWKNLK